MRQGHIDKRETHADLLADPLFAKAFAWLHAHPHPLPQAEAYPIAGADAYAKVIAYTPEHPDKSRFETHHQYVDLQVACGARPERILIADAANLTKTEDHPGEPDITFYATPAGESASIILFPAEFVIFDTERDAHMPQRLTVAQMKSGVQGENLKVVVKILRSALSPGLKL